MKYGLSRAVVTAAFIFLLSLILALAAPSRLPDSVLPCVPCHNKAGSNQFGEWLASPYSEKIGGRGCVDCHGGDCPGHRAATDLESLRKAVRLSITASCSGGAVNIEVAVSNVGVGHLLPSGSVDRDLVLEVNVSDGNKSSLPWRAGSRHLQLPPFATDTSRYRFVSPHSVPVHVSARLVLKPSNAPSLEIVETATVCGVIGEES
jgi:hypothetical protein